MGVHLGIPIANPGDTHPSEPSGALRTPTPEAQRRSPADTHFAADVGPAWVRASGTPKVSRWRKPPDQAPPQIGHAPRQGRMTPFEASDPVAPSRLRRSVTVTTGYGSGCASGTHPSRYLGGRSQPARKPGRGRGIPPPGGHPLRPARPPPLRATCALRGLPRQWMSARVSLGFDGARGYIMRKSLIITLTDTK